MATDVKFELSGERLSMRDVFERYGHCLPVIIEVTQGHYSGDIDMDTYSIGHTMRIGSYSKQLRVVAKDSNGGHLSIPVDYPIKFRVVKNQNQKKAGKEQTLREIVGETTLPVRIELCLPPAGYSLHIGQSIQQIESFGVLHLQQTYEETYFLANSINEKGVLDPEILFIPIYLKDLMVAVVQGIDGRTPTEFNKFRRDLDDVANSLTYEGVKGNPDIAVYSYESISKSSGKFYDDIQPSHFITYRPTRKGRTGSVPSLSDLQKLKRDASPAVQYGHKSSSVECRSEQVTAADPARLTPVMKDRPESPITTKTSSGRFSFGPFHAIQKPKPVTPTDSEFVKGYTIKQIVENLEALRLSKYTGVIESEQISGDILLELNADVLKSDLGMNTVEAIKLMKFAKTGYIPH